MSKLLLIQCKLHIRNNICRTLTLAVSTAGAKVIRQTAMAATRKRTFM